MASHSQTAFAVEVNARRWVAWIEPAAASQDMATGVRYGVTSSLAKARLFSSERQAGAVCMAIDTERVHPFIRQIVALGAAGQ